MECSEATPAEGPAICLVLGSIMSAPAHLTLTPRALDVDHVSCTVLTAVGRPAAEYAESCHFVAMWAVPPHDTDHPGLAVLSTVGCLAVWHGKACKFGT